MRIPIWVVLFLALTAHCLASGDPFTGKWKFDPGRSKLQTVPPKSESLTIQADGNEITLHRERSNAQGELSKLSLFGRFGGEVFGILDSDEVDALRCWRSDKRTVLFQLLKSVVTVQWLTAELSKDGKALKLTETIIDTNGREIQSIWHFDRQ
jgi:hypothetical protein